VITERYRFYCGLKDIDGNVVDPQVYYSAIDLLVPGYTVFETQGVWRGEHEKSLVFEVVALEETEKLDEFRVRVIASQLRLAGHQESVLATTEYCVRAQLIS